MNECMKHSWFDEDDAKCPYCFPPKKKREDKKQKEINQLKAELSRAQRVVEAVKEWLNLDENDLDNDEIARPVHDGLLDAVSDYERGE